MTDPQQSRTEIERINRGFMEAFRQGDAGAMAMLYSNDALLLPPGSPEIDDRDEIRAFWQGAMDMGIKEADLETREVEALGDTAIEVGRFTLRGADGQTADAGKYLVVWKREAATWRIQRDIWNSSGGK